GRWTYSAAYGASAAAEGALGATASAAESRRRKRREGQAQGRPSTAPGGRAPPAPRDWESPGVGQARTGSGLLQHPAQGRRWISPPAMGWPVDSPYREIIQNFFGIVAGQGMCGPDHTNSHLCERALRSF